VYGDTAFWCGVLYCIHNEDSIPGVGRWGRCCRRTGRVVTTKEKLVKREREMR